MYFQVQAGSALPTPLTPKLSGIRAFAAALAALFMGLAMAIFGSVQAQSTPSQGTPLNSSMDAGLFYQLLIGEIELQSGNVGTSYQVLLDAARKTKNEALFQRSTDIAVQAKAGDLALAAAQAWQAALPNSSAAYRYLIELLVALGRTPEAMPHVGTLLKISAPDIRISLINSTPRLLARTTPAELTAAKLQDVLSPYFDDPNAKVAAHVAVGRVWLAAGKPERALALAQAAQDLDVQAQEPALLALELMQTPTPTQTGASAMLERHLLARPDNLGVRLVFARVLFQIRRFNEAIAQLKWVTTHQPQAPSGWLSLGTLQLESGRQEEALKSLQTLLELLDKPALLALSGADDKPQDIEQKTWLLLSQASEEVGDLPAAQNWLNKVIDPKLAHDVLQQRVKIMAKQGKFSEARQMIGNLDASQASDLTKVLLDTLVLREAKQWSQAQSVLKAANLRLPNDVDLLYEQSMVEEKLNQLDEMERLLRKIIELKPDHYHAHNALGYAWAERNMRLPEARALIQRALELAPEDPFITDSLAWVEYRMGNPLEALRLLRKAYMNRPDADIGAHLGEVLWVSDQREEARGILRDIRKRSPHNEALKEMLSRLRIKL